MELVSTQKNKGIMTILEQTHQYLKRLGAKVLLQKNEKELQMKKQGSSNQEQDGEGEEEEGKREEVEATKVDAYGNKLEDEINQGQDDDEKEEKSNADKIKDNLRNSSKIYYRITHSVKEEIKEQPHLLKGGQLKQY